MEPEPTRYRAFLLRMWATPDGNDVRASIRDVETGESHAFASLDRLGEWLNREMRTEMSRKTLP